MVNNIEKFTWPTYCEIWLCCRRRRRFHWDCPRLRLCAPYGTSCPTYWNNTRNPAGVNPPYRSVLDCLLSTVTVYYFCQGIPDFGFPLCFTGAVGYELPSSWQPAFVLPLARSCSHSGCGGWAVVLSWQSAGGQVGRA